jgi:hypothetical protein
MGSEMRVFVVNGDSFCGWSGSAPIPEGYLTVKVPTHGTTGCASPTRTRHRLGSQTDQAPAFI